MEKFHTYFSTHYAVNKGDNKEFSEGNAADEKALKRVPSATRTEATQGGRWQFFVLLLPTGEGTKPITTDVYVESQN